MLYIFFKLEIILGIDNKESVSVPCWLLSEEALFMERTSTTLQPLQYSMT